MSVGTAPAWVPPEPLTLGVSGKRPLTGSVDIHGSKKCVPKAIVAALLTDEPCSIDGIGRIEDVYLACRLLECFGRTAREAGPRRVEISGRCTAPDDPQRVLRSLAVASRVPIVSAAAQLARFSEAWVPRLGGDRIGARPVAEHVRLLTCLGAEVSVRDGFLHATTRVLRGDRIELPYPMVGVTEHALIGASMAAGRTELLNAAIDPEIDELAAVLNQMGASVELDTERRSIAIVGAPELGGFTHQARPDRIEAGSWASAALATGGDILVRGATPTGMAPLIATHRSAGGEATCVSDGIRFTGSSRRPPSVRVDTGPYPAFESDWQSPMLVALSQTSEESVVHETVFEDRFAASQSLRRMGIELCLSAGCRWAAEPCRFGGRERAHLAAVRCPGPLVPTHAQIPDLRNGFALVVAALSASGRSVLSGAEVLQRGYEDLPNRLRALGGEVDAVS